MRRSRAFARPLVVGLALARMAADLVRGRRRARPPMPRRILVAHHLLLGDTLMLTPLLAKCRALWPSAEIVMTCPVACVGLYVTAPYGVRVLPYDPADVTTLPPLLARTAFRPRAHSRRQPPAVARPRARRRLDRRLCRRQPRLEGLAGRRAAHLPGRADGLGRPVCPPRRRHGAGAVSAQRLAAAAGGQLPSPAPTLRRAARGGELALKHWPSRRWRQLGKRLRDAGYSVALSTGPGEAALLDPIDPSGNWTRYAGTLSLAELWHLFADAELLVCPDTGVAHLARIVGVPAVVLYGPGSALLSGAGDFWRKSAYTALTVPDFPCRDQNVTMKREVAWVRRCERLPGTEPGRCAEAKCMLALGDDVVWDAVRLRLGLPVPPAPPAP